MKLNIAVLPGDGIGPEIIEQALRVIKVVCQKFGHEPVITSGLVGFCRSPAASFIARAVVQPPFKESKICAKVYSATGIALTA